jgi:hypothetical protein
MHRLRNAVAKVSKADQETFKAGWWEVFDKIGEPPGKRAVGEARRRIDAFRVQWERAYPGAVACLVEDYESLSVHLRSRKNTGRDAGTPISSSAPSARHAAGPR